MRYTCLWRTCVGFAFVTLLLAATAAFAKDGRDFAGFYSLHKVSEQGDRVSFTMKLNVSNFSDADVKQAVLSLRENTGLVLDGSTAPIKLLPNRGTARVSQKFTVSRNEFELWRGGAQPTVFIVYQSKGHQLTKYVQLAPQ